MDNQHHKISGYRDLSTEEIALINTIKQHGEASKMLLSAIRAHLEGQTAKARSLPPDEADAELDRISDAEPARWVSIARTHFQEGIMALTRAVAQPTTF